jgi:gamma-glutamylcyclotransferase (GGCT)/AIG2-like uncharacterized protein YtfP
MVQEEVLPLFVYGTLMKRFNNPWSQMLWIDGTPMGLAQVPGRLYSLGWNPGFLDPNDAGQWVYGEAVLPRNPAVAYAKLDAYEGGAFERVKRRIVLGSGGEIYAYLYLYKGRVRELNRIVSGRFE